MYKVTCNQDGLTFSKQTNPQELRSFCKTIGKCERNLRCFCVKQLQETNEVHCSMLYYFIEAYDKEMKKLQQKKGNKNG